MLFWAVGAPELSPGSAREERQDSFTNVCPALKPMGGGQRDFLLSASLHLPSAQNNLYAEVAYSGMTYSATLRYQPISLKSLGDFTLPPYGIVYFHMPS